MRLFTNLRYVTIGTGGRPVRTMCAAVLLEEPDPRFGEDSAGMMSGMHRVRGFGPDPAWPVFDLVLDCEIGQYEMRDYEGNLILLRDDGSTRPINAGRQVTFKDGTVLLLNAEDYERPIAIDEFEAADYDALWPTLARRAAEFWTAPYMPHLHHAPPGSVPHRYGATVPKPPA